MNTPDIKPQQARENPDPHERMRPVPRLLLALVAAMVVFGIVYISRADIETASAWGDGREAAELAGSKTSKAEKIDGAAIYAALCSACHQASGQGLPGVFPPLAGSEWVLGKDSTVAAIVLHGINGAVSVKGAAYNGAMPSFKDQLSDAQIAAVLSHVRSQWGNQAAALTPEGVADTRAAHQARTAPFAGEKELPPHD